VSGSVRGPDGKPIAGALIDPGFAGFARGRPVAAVTVKQLYPVFNSPEPSSLGNRGELGIISMDSRSSA
jgi:hypothetical protein